MYVSSATSTDARVMCVRVFPGVAVEVAYTIDVHGIHTTNLSSKPGSFFVDNHNGASWSDMGRAGQSITHYK